MSGQMARWVKDFVYSMPANKMIVYLDKVNV